MTADSDWGSTGINQESVKQTVADFVAKKQAQELYTDKDVEEWAKRSRSNNSKICCLVYGSDGCGKTGIVYDYLSDADVKTGYSLWVIDLDGGGMPLKESYHKKKGSNLVIIDPLVTYEDENGTQLDYLKTFAKVRAVIRYVTNHWEKEKIKAIVFDGLTTALGYAEQQMRLEKSIDADGGVQLRYWLMRNKLFLETLEQIKVLPIARFFIAHENFIVGDDPQKKTSSVVAKTNAMMVQKIKCQRVNMPNTTEFYAVVDKSKYNVTAEGQRLRFCEVDKDKKTYKWDTTKIFKLLEGENGSAKKEV
jgi:hypothetical protein